MTSTHAEEPMIFEDGKDGGFPEGFEPRERSYSRTMSFASQDDNGLAASKEERRLFGLAVKHGVTRWNLSAIIVTPLVIMLIQTYLNAKIVLLLEDGYFNLPEDNPGEVAGALISFSLPPALIFTMLSGYVYDIVGRRLTIYVSFALASTLIYFVPHMAPNVFPNLMLLRMGIAIAMVPPISSPLIGDYLDKDSIGKGAALVGVGYIIGEILSMGVLFTITKPMTPDNSFLTVSIICNVISLAFLFIVREPLLRKREKDISREEAREQHIARMSTVNKADAFAARQEIS
jgi:MFS family permease